MRSQRASDVTEQLSHTYMLVSAPLVAKSVIIIAMLNYLFFFFLTTPRGIWDLSSLIRVRTRTLCTGTAES